MTASGLDDLRSELVELLRRYGLQIPTAQGWLGDFERAVRGDVLDRFRAAVADERALDDESYFVEYELGLVEGFIDEVAARIARDAAS